MNRVYSVVAIGFIGAAMLFTGCKSGAEKVRLESPVENGGEMSNGGSSVVTDVNGVHMEVTPSFPAGFDTTVNATTLQLIIENNSDRPLLVRYDYFILVSDAGQTFAAVPLYDVEGAVIAGAPPRIGGEFKPITSPRFEFQQFMVAPYYSEAYPTIQSFTGPFLFGDEFYSAYGNYFEEPLPQGVRSWVIPEGVLASGGRLHGVLLFQRVNPDVKAVYYRASLVGAEDFRLFGNISIPFRVIQETAQLK